MWKNKDYDNLMTFNDYIETFGAEPLFDGYKMETDEATRDAIIDWFYYRKIVDNERFLKFFRRAINMYENQYYGYVRVEMTDIDPLVSNYLERQILRTGTRAETGTETGTETDTKNRRTTANGNNTGTTETETTGTATGTGTSTGTTTESGSTSGNSNTNTRHKHGETPQSYIGGGSDGMTLDWSYLSSQDQEQAASETTGSTTGTTTSNGSTTDNTRTTGNATTETRDTSTSESATTESSGTTKSGNTSRNENSNEDTRERLTGRQEAPQDLLNRARDYVENTNAFLWLCGKLDNCFMQVLEM